MVIAGASGGEGGCGETAAEGPRPSDLILIDRAPSLDQLTINGLTAAVIVVTTPKRWSAIGLRRLLRHGSAASAVLQPQSAGGRVIVNRKRRPHPRRYTGSTN